MTESNKAVLENANAAIVAGDNEGFLALCTDDIVWTAVGESRLQGKQAVREWMKTAYAEPPEFTVKQMVAEGDFVVALGDIVANDANGRPHSPQAPGMLFSARSASTRSASFASGRPS